MLSCLSDFAHQFSECNLIFATCNKPLSSLNSASDLEI